MSKRISSRKLADEYAKAQRDPWDKGDSEGNLKEGFLAGWAARGKADQDIVIDHGCKGNIENSTSLYERLSELDEQD